MPGHLYYVLPHIYCPIHNGSMHVGPISLATVNPHMLCHEALYFFQ